MAIHPTAVIDPKAEVDSSVEVGPYCIIDADVRVAAGCRLINHVYLTGWTEIGEGCTMHSGVVVGEAPQDITYGGERSYCILGKGTILREHVTIHRGTVPESRTVVGEDCFLLAGSHIGHNCTVGNRVTLVNDVLLGGHVHVADGVTLGGGAGIHQFVRIGELAMIAGTGVVTMDILPYAMVNTAGRIAGINRIGLKRAKFSREEFEDVRNAYRILFGKSARFNEAIKQVKNAVATPAGRRLAEFLTAESRRGIAGSSRSGKLHT